VVELTDEAEARGLTYLAPGMPTEGDWDRIPAGEPVLIRGLGANFFDGIGLLFEGRGGRFVRGTDGQLSYRPTGSEPRVLAGSRHGLPYRAKAYYASGLPEPTSRTRAMVDALSPRLSHRLSHRANARCSLHAAGTEPKLPAC
jgi:hypothetical protein